MKSGVNFPGSAERAKKRVRPPFHILNPSTRTKNHPRMLFPAIFLSFVRCSEVKILSAFLLHSPIT